MFSLVILSCHEAAHAVVALRLGDKTAYHNGQVTLNPWPHMPGLHYSVVLGENTSSHLKADSKGIMQGAGPAIQTHNPFAAEVVEKFVGEAQSLLDQVAAKRA